MKPAAHPVTPYMRARQEWDDRLGTLYSQTKLWRSAALISSAIGLVLAVSMGVLAQRATVVPVVVGLDRERGEPVVIGPVGPMQFRAGPTEIKYFLTQLIHNVRSVPLDPVVMRRNWESAYAYLTLDASTLMGEWARKPESHVAQIGKKTVTVQPVAITQVANSESYQARWEETVYDYSGRLVDQYTMTGVFTVARKDPTEEKSLLMNPLGLFVTNFQWTRELPTQSASLTQRAAYEG